MPPGAIRGGFLLLPDVLPTGSRLCWTLVHFKEDPLLTHPVAYMGKVRLTFRQVRYVVWCRVGEL